MQPLESLSPEPICAEVGKRVRQLRLQHNLTQQQLADRTWGSLSSIRRLEARGQAPLLLLVRVSQALQVVEQWNGLFQPADAFATRKRARSPRTP